MQSKLALVYNSVLSNNYAFGYDIIVTMMFMFLPYFNTLSDSKIVVSEAMNRSDDSLKNRYAYLLLLLSKLKIENVALRSRLDADSCEDVLNTVSKHVAEL